MPILVRRINRSKWEAFDFTTDDNAPADAITNCLKTFNNELSIWQIDSLDELEKAILCLVTGSKQENLGTIHIIYFDSSKIDDYNLTTSKSDGDTVISEYKNSHLDIGSLNYNSLGYVKNLIIECLRAGNCQTITRSQLRKIISRAIEEKILDKNLLHPLYQEVI